MRQTWPLNEFTNMPPNGLHGYESWLDTLDAKLFVERGAVKVCFDFPLVILLHDCTDLQGLKLQAAQLRSALARNQTHLPRKHLIERFVRLVLLHNRLKLAHGEVMRELKAEWSINDEFHDY